jgi:hypothetical protein
LGDTHSPLAGGILHLFTSTYVAHSWGTSCRNWFETCPYRVLLEQVLQSTHEGILRLGKTLNSPLLNDLDYTTYRNDQDKLYNSELAQGAG